MLTTTRRRRPRSYWTPDGDQALREFYSSSFAEELRLRFPGRTMTNINYRAHKLGLAHGSRKVWFPAAYTDAADGNYVSGLTDGEGSFAVSIKFHNGRWNFNPKFTVSLRLDDSSILLWMMTYFQCGRLQEAQRPKQGSPMAYFTVADLYSLLSRVVPHFDACPLRAKKRHDYAIWREMLFMQAEYFRQPWTETVRRRMQTMYERLKTVRLLNGTAGL